MRVLFYGSVVWLWVIILSALEGGRVNQQCCCVTSRREWALLSFHSVCLSVCPSVPCPGVCAVLQTMAASKRANAVPSALVARQSLNDEELVRNVFHFYTSHHSWSSCSFIHPQLYAIRRVGTDLKELGVVSQVVIRRHDDTPAWWYTGMVIHRHERCSIAYYYWRGQMSKCLKFCTGIEILNHYHSKMSVCRHELRGERVRGGWTPLPSGNSNLGYICHSCLERYRGHFRNG